MDIGHRRRQLLAGLLAAAWLAGAVVILLVYRPGGPFDPVPAALRLAIAAVAAVALLRPPPEEMDRRGAASWLALASLFLLVPAVWMQARQPTSQAVPLLPAPESLYPWFLALLGTCAYVGLGLAGGRGRIADRPIRPTALRGLVVGALVALGGATLGSAAVVANDAALAAGPPVSSPYGPTGADPDPPSCDGALDAGPGAAVTMELYGVVDRTDIGTVTLAGSREGADFSWTAAVATTVEAGQRGAARAGPGGWLLDERGAWVAVDPEELDPWALDARAVEMLLTPGGRVVNETVAIDLVEGARARHCRAAVDGPAFLAAFPQTAWFIGEVDPVAWRGWVDWWVFADGQLGLLDGYIDGLAAEMTPSGIRVTVHVRLAATDRDQPHPVSPPGPRG